MKKILLNLSDALLSNEQARSVKGGYQGWNPSSPGPVSSSPTWCNFPIVPRGGYTG